jgi:polyisoprenoid-binding protein YceI
MTLTRSVPFVLAAALNLTAATIPQDSLLQIDPAQTKIEFTLGATLHTVHGSFQLKRGDMRFDPATGRASGEIVVNAASGESGNDSRDKKMHKEVLESGRYPEIAFRPDRVEGAVAPRGVSHVQIHGVFSIHGADHAVTMPADVEAGDGQYTAAIKFSVPYIEWGMKNPSTLMLRVSQKVDITIHTVAKAAR